MRTDMIVIGGQKYPVKGLSVTQSLTEDILAAEANQGNDISKRVDVRLRRMAISLQNGKAFLPDTTSPRDEATGLHRGSFEVEKLPVEKIIKLLDGDLFSDAAEFYAAEEKVMELTGFVKPKGALKENQPGAGELQASE